MRGNCSAKTKHAEPSRISSERGVAPTQLNEWKTTATKGLVRLFEDDQRDLQKLQAAHEEEKAAPRRLSGDRATDHPVDLAEKKLDSTRTRHERVAMIDWAHMELDIKTQAVLLGVSRSGLYYKLAPVSPEGWRSNGGSMRFTLSARSMGRPRSRRS